MAEELYPHEGAGPGDLFVERKNLAYGRGARARAAVQAHRAYLQVRVVVG